MSEKEPQAVQHTKPAVSPSDSWWAVLLGWPLLFGVIAFLCWFTTQLMELLRWRTVTRAGLSSIDPVWAAWLQPVMFVPTIVIFSYLNWLGWKFFQHN